MPQVPGVPKSFAITYESALTLKSEPAADAASVPDVETADSVLTVPVPKTKKES